MITNYRQILCGCLLHCSSAFFVFFPDQIAKLEKNPKIYDCEQQLSLSYSTVIMKMEAARIGYHHDMTKVENEHGIGSGTRQ